MSSFHSREGFFFERSDEDGSVRISKVLWGVPRADQARVEVVAYEVTLPPNEWASVVAAVSAKGESTETWNAALRLHDNADEAGAE